MLTTPRLQYARDIRGHALKKNFRSKRSRRSIASLRSRRSPPSGGSRFNVQSFKGLSLTLAAERFALFFAFCRYFFALSRTTPAPEDFTMAKFMRSKGLRVVRLLASDTVDDSVLSISAISSIALIFFSENVAEEVYFLLFSFLPYVSALSRTASDPEDLPKSMKSEGSFRFLPSDRPRLAKAAAIRFRFSSLKSAP